MKLMIIHKITGLLITFSNVSVVLDGLQMFVESVVLTAFQVLCHYQNDPFDDSKLLRHLL